MKTKNETKSIKFDIKASDNTDKFMTFTGIGSPFNGKADGGGDVVEEGAYAISLKQKGDKRVLLWHHDSKEPIGTVSLEETKEGLMIKEGLINKNIKRGAEVAELIEMGALKGLSIGYRAVKTAFKNGNRMLKEIALFEMSIVPFPMDEDAMITSAKAEAEALDFNGVLSMAIDKLEEAKEGDIELISSTVKKLNTFLMKSFDDSIQSVLDNSLSDQGEPVINDSLSQEEEKGITEEYIKNDLNNFFKGLNK